MTVEQNKLAESPIGVQELQAILEQSTLLVSAAEIDEAISRLAEKISLRFAGDVPLLMCIMNGGLMLTGRLMSELSIFAQLDYMQTSRYRDGTVGGTLNWRVKPDQSIEGRSVVLIDDIFDEGHTLAGIHAHCLDSGASKVCSVVLFDKEHDHKVDHYRPDLVGMAVQDHYLFGFGMDYGGHFRHLPDVYALSMEEDK